MYSRPLMAMSRHRASGAAMSASRSEADVSDLEFGTSAFYVCLPLRSGRRRRARLRSAVDPKEKSAHLNKDQFRCYGRRRQWLLDGRGNTRGQRRFGYRVQFTRPQYDGQRGSLRAPSLFVPSETASGATATNGRIRRGPRRRDGGPERVNRRINTDLRAVHEFRGRPNLAYSSRLKIVASGGHHMTSW